MRKIFPSSGDESLDEKHGLDFRVQPNLAISRQCRLR